MKTEQDELEAMATAHQEELHRLWHLGWAARLDMRRPMSIELFGGLANVLWAHIETINQEIIAERLKFDGKRPGCAKGCATCCYQTIEVGSPELIRIALALRRSPGIEAYLAAKSVAIAPLVAALTKPERYTRSIPCPALINHTCSIYDARPIACRTYLSMSRAACLRDWDRRFQPRRDHHADIPFLAMPQMAGQASLAGFDAAFHATGLELVRVELAAGLARVLATPDAPERWLAGESIFAGLPEPQVYAEDLDKMIAYMTTKHPIDLLGGKTGGKHGR